MKIATWNVNSLRVRLSQVTDWLAEQQPDILAVQETKVQDADFPQQELQSAGYQSVFSGQRAYNGVALLSNKPIHEIVAGLPARDDPQRRFLGATIGDVRVINVYVPNGESVESPKFQYKIHWLKALREYIAGQLQGYSNLVVLGDFNIAPRAEDVHNPELWRGRVLFSDVERDLFRELLQLGLEDAFRIFEQPPKSYSWWDYRMNAFRRKMGLRIDHILVNDNMRNRCSACVIDESPRSLTRPSDHAPVIACFEGT